jgi:uncharacterized integral membrane protein
MSAPPQSPEPHQTERPHQAERARRSRREQTRTAALVILSILITLFAVLNLKDVRVNWIVGSGHAPLIIVIAVSLLVGIMLAYFAQRRGGRRQ